MNLRRIVLLVGLVLLGILQCFSTIQNISDCGQSLISTNSLFLLNQSINDSGGTCIWLGTDEDDSILDCQGFNITDLGGTTYGIRVDSNVENITIRNCNVYGFTRGMFTGGSMIEVYNSTFFNTQLELELNNVILRNSLLNNVLLELNDGLSNSTFDKLTFENDSNIQMSNVVNSTFTNLDLRNLSSPLFMYSESDNNNFYNVSISDLFFLSGSTNNSFVNSSFDSSISSSNWSQTLNFFENNSYVSSIINGSGCIITAQPEVICDTGIWSIMSLVTNQPTTSSLFPFLSLYSVVMFLGLYFLL